MTQNFKQTEPYLGFTDRQQGGYQSFVNHPAAPTGLDFQQTHPLGWDQEMWQHNNAHTGYGHGNFQQGSFDNHPDHQGRPYFRPIPPDVLPYDTPHGQEEWANEDAQGYFVEPMNGGPEYHNMSSQHYQTQPTFDGVNELFGSRQIRNPTLTPSMSRAPASSNTAAAIPPNSDKQRNTSTPTLSNSVADLKARVIASVSRKRTENSTTPTQGAATAKASSTGMATTTKNENELDSSIPKSAVGDKTDIRTDIDGLVAEVKAATSANVKKGDTNEEGGTTRQKAQTVQKEAHSGPRNSDTASAKASISTNKQKMEIPNRTVKMSTNGSGESAEASEAGEIREEPSNSRSSDRNRRNVQSTQPDNGDTGHYSGYMEVDEEVGRNAMKPTSYVRQDTFRSSGRIASESIHPDIVDDGASFRNRDDRQVGGRGSRQVIEVEPSPLTSPRDDPRELQRQIDHRHQQLYRVLDHDDSQRRSAVRLVSEYEQPLPRQYVDGGLRFTGGEPAVSYSADIEDWLEMTRYHDREYRLDALRRFRELRALQARQTELRAEAEAAQRRVFLRGKSLNPSAEIGHGTAKAFYINPRAPSVYDMPPPPLPDREDLATRITTRSPAVYVTSRHADEPAAVRYVESPTSMLPEGGSLKRRYTTRDPELSESGPSDKIQRIDSKGRTGSLREEMVVASPQQRHARDPVEDRDDMDTNLRRRETFPRGRPASRSAYDRQVRRSHSPSLRPSGGPQYRDAQDEGVRIAGSSLKNRGSYSREISPSHRRPGSRESNHTESHKISPREDYRDRSSHRRASDDDFRGGQNGRSFYEYNGRGGYPGRGRGRGNSYGYRGGRNNDRGGKYSRLENRTGWDFRGRKGDTRYFMVKSFNSENVIQAQEENVWATQEKNAELFAEAFQNTRNVILIFSVNKSAAFQGYARMESAPGTAQTPSWAKTLLWKSSGPFRIKWVTIAETRFSRISHLRNSLNEDQPVLIGRDGQEIEEECGAGVCDIIDQEADRMARG
ncbi:MAG: hypothetical protein M1839_006559 [Geoglossum umbratile]|nr:MAG: hypothetical protein M1839_006559 [Geoglossum umbratile]